MAEPRVLKLQSPAYGEPIFYKWPLANTKKQDEATEIADTIKLVCEDFPELKYAVENFILKDYEPNDYDSMSQLCQRYNKAIKNILQLWKGRAPPPHMFKPAKKELLRHVINLCYSNAIKEPEKLNLYEPFSPEVYGETSFDMVAQILDECRKTNEETFIDLGSGVGQVVLQAAATTNFKECIGIEKAETPAMYAQAMDAEFRKWMDWFGKIYTDFTLDKGDFLEEKWTETINNTGFVFVNNFAFGPVVNHHLKQRFQQMKEGAKIISSREFCPLNFKFNKRNLSELGAMMRVTELKPKSEEQTVSWTGNNISYYLHIVDRTRLEKYFSILKKRKEGRELDEDELSLYSESNLSMDTTGTPKHEETLEDNLDDLYLGTTTRHQWQVLNKTIQQSRQDATPPVKGDYQKKKVKKKKKKKKLLIRDETEEEDDVYVDDNDGDDGVPFDEKPSVKKNLPKSGNIKMKEKILQKYGYQKMKKNLLLPSTALPSTSSTNNNKGISRFVPRRKSNKVLSITTSPSATDSEETDSAFENELAGGDDNNNNKIKTKSTKKSLTKKNKEEPKIAKKKLGVQFQSDKRTVTAARKQKDKKVTKKEKSTKSVGVTEKSSVGKKEGLSKKFLDTLDKDIDSFYDDMKSKAKEFIRRMNTQEYAERLKVMIECEQTKKKLLQREVCETEQVVQQLITSGLGSFTTRLGELDLAVKTPLEMLSTSTHLAEKRQQLEDKVVNMEVEVLGLEEKYKNMCNARSKRGGSVDVTLLSESLSGEVLDNRRNEVTSQLCGSILSALNHRRGLLDKQSSLSDQISILEKIASPPGSTHQHGHGEQEFDAAEEEAKVRERPKLRPVAFVPPRVLSDDKMSTVSPETPTHQQQQQQQQQHETVRRPRGRPKKAKHGETVAETSSTTLQPAKTEENNNLSPSVLQGIPLQTSTSFSPPTSSHYNVYRVTEERAPIVFPNKMLAHTTVDDVGSEEFLKASSELLNSKGKWKPLNEVQTKLHASDEKQALSSVEIVSRVSDTRLPLAESTSRVSDMRLPLAEPTARVPDIRLPLAELMARVPDTRLPLAEPMSRVPDTRLPLVEPTSRVTDTRSPLVESTELATTKTAFQTMNVDLLKQKPLNRPCFNIHDNLQLTTSRFPDTQLPLVDTLSRVPNTQLPLVETIPRVPDTQDNLQRTFSQQLFNRSLVNTNNFGSPRGNVQADARSIFPQTSEYLAMNGITLPQMHQQLLNSSRVLSTAVPHITTEASKSHILYTGQASTSSHVIPVTQTNAPKERSKKKSDPTAKPKRGRKRKGETAGNVIIPGNHKQADKEKLAGHHHTVPPSKHDQDIEHHFQSSLQKFYKPPSSSYVEHLPAKHMQSVITLNPVPHTYPLSGHSASIVIPPSVPSHIQAAVSQRQSNLELLKQAALAALPEKPAAGEPFQTLSTPAKHHVVPPSTAKLLLGQNKSGIISHVAQHPGLYPYTKQSPLNTTSDALYHLHNRILQQNTSPVSIPSSGVHSYVPIVPSTNFNKPPTNPNEFKFNLEPSKLSPAAVAMNGVIFGAVSSHHGVVQQQRTEALPTPPKNKRQKKESKKKAGNVPVIISSAILPTPSPVHGGGLLRSVLLPTNAAIPTNPLLSPQTLLVVNNSNVPQHQQLFKQTQHPRLLASLPHSPLPVVQTFSGPTPLVILPVPPGAPGKYPQSTNASPTFPPPGPPNTS